jgi:hypothetical protein
MLHLGFDEGERATSPYARFFRPDMAPLPVHVREALLTGAIAHELLPAVGAAKSLQGPGYWPVETGYALSPDGAMRVFVLSEMPNVTPAMWAWWFAWHGSEAQRYKLWHPRAHVHAAWQDGRDDLAHYVGRTSNVVEYIGSTRMKLTIRFVPPASLGLDEGRLAASGDVAICARGGIAGAPIETGWLIHHVRSVAGGSEMRSRFWIAGENIQPRGVTGRTGALIGRALGAIQRPAAPQAADLLVHCAQEMNHLAAILPDLCAAFAKPV